MLNCKRVFICVLCTLSILLSSCNKVESHVNRRDQLKSVALSIFTDTEYIVDYAVNLRNSNELYSLYDIDGIDFYGVLYVTDDFVDLTTYKEINNKISYVNHIEYDELKKRYQNYL